MPRKYKKNRKFPVAHTVKPHTRLGNPVTGFTRGSGTHPQKLSRSPVVGRSVGKGVDDSTPMGVHGFVVNFTYSDKPGDGESVLVLSDNYEDALDESYEEIMDPRSPLSVEVIDPDIGAMLKWTGERVRSAIKYGKPNIVKATKLGAKYAVKATMATGATVKKVAIAGAGGAKELERLTAFGVQKELIQSLLKLCFQKDKSKRIAARAALKKRYPDVYAMCDFSKESKRRPRNIPKVYRFPTSYRW